MKNNKLGLLIILLLFLNLTGQSVNVNFNFVEKSDTLFNRNSVFLELRLNSILGSDNLKDIPLEIWARSDYSYRLKEIKKINLFLYPALSYEYGANIRNSVLHKLQSHTILYGVGLEKKLHSRQQFTLCAGFQVKHLNEFVNIKSNNEVVKYINKGMEYNAYLNPEMRTAKYSIGSILGLRYTNLNIYRNNSERLNFQTVLGATFKF